MNTRRLSIIAFTLGMALLVTVLAAILWLSLRPGALAGLINARLPPGAHVAEISGLQLSVGGGSLDALVADWDDARIVVAGARWHWQIESLWPLQLGPQSIELESLQLRLAPASAEPAVLPRFWEQDWWPMLASLQLRIQQLDVADASAVPLLGGMLEAAALGDAGQARVRLADLAPVVLNWQRADKKMRLQWRSDTPVTSNGRIEAWLSGEGVDWTLQGQLPPYAGAGIAMRDIAIKASGSANPFDAQAILASAELRASGTATVEEQDALWSCEARLRLDWSLQSILRLAECSAESQSGALALQVPLTVRLNADNAIEGIEAEAGSLHISKARWSDWRLDELDVRVTPGRIYDPLTSRWMLPPLRFDGALVNATKAIEARVQGALADAFLVAGEASAALDATLRIKQTALTLAPLTIQAKVRATESQISAKGAAGVESIGELLVFDGAYQRASLHSHALVELNSSHWRWGKGLLANLLGPKQTRMPGDVLGGELRAKLVFDANPQRTRVELTGSASGVLGMVAGFGFAGLNVAPFALVYRDGVLASKAPLEWRIDNVHAGILLNQVQGRFAGAGADWVLSDVSGQLLGGSFSLPALALPGEKPVQAMLSLKGIDLARVAALLDNPDIQLQGRVNASLPLRILGSEFTVQDGSATGEGSGSIQYLAKSGSAEPGELAMTRKALSNLQYDSLDATLQYAADGKLLLATGIRGRNPDLDSKRPVHLNLTLDTNLRTLLQSLRAGDRVSNWLARRAKERKS